ncbi:MAG: GntR family transcriptional regulator [Anaerolineales bacterium]|nr:GntR family transcriptional regulator [Anaerolineales bacterium]
MAKRISRAKEVELKLLDLIEKGEWNDGRLPSETDLAGQFQVSRVTVREALSSLAGMGVVQRKHGLGTFISKDWFGGSAGIQARLDEPFELGTMITQSGFDMTISVVSFNYGKTTERNARLLNISADDETFTVHKIFMADGMPAISVQNIVPLNLSLDKAPLEVRGMINPEEQIYLQVEKLFGRTTGYLISDIKPMLVTEELTKYLDRPVGSPILHLEEVAYSTDGEPLWVALEHHVPGIINFRLKRTLFKNTNYPG